LTSTNVILSVTFAANSRQTVDDSR
jgi:hypothetical protein